MGGHQPYLYEPMGRQDTRFPQKPFDPKAVTRASFEPQQARLRHDGPLISFNRHPDAHLVLTHRSSEYQPLSPRMKGWIKGMRVFQLFLRVLQLIGAMGVLALYVILTKVATAAAWILRIAPAIATMHCAYGIYHLSRPAGGRTPASSAAYQVFAGVSDFCMLPIYAFGVYVARLHGSSWGNLFDDKSLMQFLVPAAEYTALGAGAIHVISLCISVWLGFMFRRIALMPPDLNPLEDRFTSRVRHKRNKSSIATASTGESEAASTIGPQDHCRSRPQNQDLSRPPMIPFMRTRTNSASSHKSRDSRVDLPSRHYQIVPGNASPRASVASSDLHHVPAITPLHRHSYNDIAGGDQYGATTPRRPLSGTDAGGNRGAQRVAKFTETWSTTDSLISRTQQRQRMMRGMYKDQPRHQNPYQSYEALDERYDATNGIDSDSEGEQGNGSSAGLHPQPLRSNPTTVTAPCQPDPSCIVAQRPRPDSAESLSQRVGSIQLERDFFSKPYGQLKPATPPIIVGSNRQVSSGNDYEKNAKQSLDRRVVSGKIAEEGRVATRYSRYGALNED